MNNDDRINFRVSGAKKRTWLSKAKSMDMSLSEWITIVCDNQIDSAVPLIETPEQIVAPPTPTGTKRNYTGATSFMFHKKQYEYVDDNGKSMWTPEAP